jgi:4-amino-4-deoxy-L-arabinose transferase-like glycosyltransferase
VLLLFVLALGLFVRVYRLGSWPSLFFDEATPGVRASRVLRYGWDYMMGNRLYFSPYYVLVQIPAVAALGNTLIALRLSSLVNGLLCILAAYATGRRLWDPGRALMAAAVAAILPLSVVIGGRLAWEPSLAFPLVAWALYFAVVAGQRRSVAAAAASGILLALSSYAHPAALLAVPGLVLGTILSGKVRVYWRESIVAMLLFVVLSFPSTTFARQLLATGNIDVDIFLDAPLETLDMRLESPFSPVVIGENVFRTLDQWTGAVTAQFFLGPLRAPWSLPIKLLRVGCVGLWLIVLVVAARSGAVGRFMVGYMIGVFVAGHISHPGFVSLPHRGRYLFAAAVMVPLLVSQVAKLQGDSLSRLSRHAVYVMFVVWVGVTTVMLSFIYRDIVSAQMVMTTAVGDPNKAASDYLLQHVDLERDLVLTPWYGAWPLKFYSIDRLPLFTANTRSETEPVRVPDWDAIEKVWWLRIGDSERPPFPADLVQQYEARGAPGRLYTIWIAHDTADAIAWAIADYQAELEKLHEAPGEH